MITFDANLVGALLAILSAVLSAFVAVSRYTSNLKLRIQQLSHDIETLQKDRDFATQELSHELEILRSRTGSIIRQLKHADAIQNKRIEDLENKLKIDLKFQPRYQISYDTDASWLKDT